MSEANALEKPHGKPPDVPNTLQGLLGLDAIRKRFEEVLGKRAAAFMSNLITVTNGNDYLKKCNPQTVIAAGAQAASLDLAILPSLGHAHIVPYDGLAQFQMGWKGYVQLAHRTGQYRKINLAQVYDGQLIEYDEFTGVVKLDAKAKKSDKVVGWFFFFELLNGYRHEAYWSVERCHKHGKRYSKSYQKGKGPWVDIPEAMEAKTVVKMELSKWGILSVEMQQAIESDQAVIRVDGSKDYIDTTIEPPPDAPMPHEKPTGKPKAAEPEALTLEGEALPCDRIKVKEVGRMATTPPTFTIKSIKGGVYLTKDYATYELADQAKLNNRELIVEYKRTENGNDITRAVLAEKEAQ